MRRLIWTFAVRICQKTRFHMARPDYTVLQKHIHIASSTHEPQDQKTFFWICAPSDDSDRLISFFLGTFWIAKDASFLLADNKFTDQSARMRYGGTSLPAHLTRFRRASSEFCIFFPRVLLKCSFHIRHIYETTEKKIIIK